MKLSLCTMGAMLKDIRAGLGLMILKDPVQPEICFYDLLTSEQRQCESLLPGLILFCYTDKILNPPGQLFPDGQILPMHAHMFPSTAAVLDTPELYFPFNKLAEQELCGQECPVR